MPPNALGANLSISHTRDSDDPYALDAAAQAEKAYQDFKNRPVSKYLMSAAYQASTDENTLCKRADAMQRETERDQGRSSTGAGDVSILEDSGSEEWGSDSDVDSADGVYATTVGNRILEDETESDEQKTQRLEVALSTLTKQIHDLQREANKFCMPWDNWFSRDPAKWNEEKQKKLEGEIHEQVKEIKKIKKAIRLDILPIDTSA